MQSFDWYCAFSGILRLLILKIFGSELGKFFDNIELEIKTSIFSFAASALAGI